MSDTVLVFPHVEGHWSAEDTVMQRDLARIMVASARRAMPGVPIKMLTDPATPALDFVDEVLRKPIKGWAWITWLCDFCAQIDGQVLYMDTDVVIQRDLRPMFNVPFDVMLTSRGPKNIEGREMPFLFGVVPYRTREFWLEVRDRVFAMPHGDDQNWWGSQVAACDMWVEEQNGRGKWKIAVVGCDPHNFTPKNAEDKPADKWVLHYKGRKRKKWMLEAWGERQAVAA
jgi:hypothetical protein